MEIQNNRRRCYCIAQVPTRFWMRRVYTVVKIEKRVRFYVHANWKKNVFDDDDGYVYFVGAHLVIHYVLKISLVHVYLLRGDFRLNLKNPMKRALNWLDYDMMANKKIDIIYYKLTNTIICKQNHSVVWSYRLICKHQFQN